MRVAVVDPAAYSLPYDVALCEALGAEGHEVTLYTTRFAHGAMPRPEHFELVEWFYRRRVPGLPRRVARGLQHPLDMRRLARHLARERPDVVHVQWSVLHRIDIPTWQRLELPVVFTAHNSVEREEALTCGQLHAFDAVVAHSELGARSLRERCGLPRVWQVAHGAFDSFAELADPDQLPVQLDDGPVVSLAGLLRPYKGVDVLLDAWPGVLEHVPDAQLVIAGRPMGMELPEQLPERAHVLGRFLDEREFAWLLRRSDLVCLPYRQIDLSGVLFSAIALGRPMLLSDVGGFSELRGQGAELVPPGDAGALERALVALLGDARRRDELAAESARAGRERYSWDAIARQYTQLYGELVANAAQGGAGQRTAAGAAGS